MRINSNNYLFVFGENKNQLDEFMSDAMNEQEPLSMEKLYPTPEGAGAGWREDHWGTPGMKMSELRYHTDLVLCYYLKTAMFAPTEWVQQISVNYPHLGFFMRFVREDTSFVGGIVAKGEYSYQMSYNENLIYRQLVNYVLRGFENNREKRVKDLAAFYGALLVDQELVIGLEE